MVSFLVKYVTKRGGPRLYNGSDSELSGSVGDVSQRPHVRSFTWSILISFLIYYAIQRPFFRRLYCLRTPSYGRRRCFPARNQGRGNTDDL